MKSGLERQLNLVSDKSLKTIFLEKAEGCKKAVTVLQNKVKELGVNYPAQRGSVLGSLHRGWLNINMVLSDNDSIVLEGCERAEEVAKDVYTKALEQELPEEVRRVVQHQYEGLLKNYELVRNLRNTHDATRKN